MLTNVIYTFTRSMFDNFKEACDYASKVLYNSSVHLINIDCKYEMYRGYVWKIEVIYKEVEMECEI